MVCTSGQYLCKCRSRPVSSPYCRVIPAVHSSPTYYYYFGSRLHKYHSTKTRSYTVHISSLFDPHTYCCTYIPHVYKIVPTTNMGYGWFNIYICNRRSSRGKWSSCRLEWPRRIPPNSRYAGAGQQIVNWAHVHTSHWYVFMYQESARRPFWVQRLPTPLRPPPRQEWMTTSFPTAMEAAQVHFFFFCIICSRTASEWWLIAPSRKGFKSND